MNTGKMLFAQMMEFLPKPSFVQLVDQHGRDRYT